MELYNRSLAEAKDLWADQVQSYKRNRRNKGLAKVSSLMDSRMSATQLADFADVPKYYSQFKVHAAKDLGFLESESFPVVAA